MGARAHSNVDERRGPCGRWGTRPPAPPFLLRVDKGASGRALQEPTCASECPQPPPPPCSKGAPGRKTGHLGGGRGRAQAGASPPLSAWTLNLDTDCPPPPVQLPQPHAKLAGRTPAGPPQLQNAPCPTSPSPRLLEPANSSSPRPGEGSSPLKQPTSSAIPARSRAAVHSSWVGGKVRAAAEPCCRAWPMACMRRC